MGLRGCGQGRAGRIERCARLRVRDGRKSACKNQWTEGLPDMMLDFKSCFTLLVKEIYRQSTIAGGAKRWCRLEMPYREHLQSRGVLFATSYLASASPPVG